PAKVAFQNPFLLKILRSIGSVNHDVQYSLVHSSGNTQTEIHDEVERMVYGSYVDGIILFYSRQGDPVASFLHEKNFPFLMVGQPSDHDREITYVDNDNFLAGKEITEYLINMGHDKIAFIGGSKDLFVTEDRESW